jgi:hypothetical protein
MDPRITDKIISIFDEKFYPDYNWGSHEDYQKYVSKWGEEKFNIDDNLAYIYKDGKKFGLDGGVLFISPEITIKLNNMFGDNWKSIFQLWFEQKTSLKVARVVAIDDWAKWIVMD